MGGGEGGTALIQTADVPLNQEILVLVPALSWTYTCDFGQVISSKLLFRKSICHEEIGLADG